jgi:hypothetical protein
MAAAAPAPAHLPFFSSIGNFKTTIPEQFKLLIQLIYAKEERIKQNIYYRGIRNPDNLIFKDTAFSNMPLDRFPDSIEELFNLYIGEPVSEADRSEFMETFVLAYQSTGKSVKELYILNPKAFSESLDALIISKRIQQIEPILSILKGFLSPVDIGRLEKDKLELLGKLKHLYNTQEEVIAVAWTRAIEHEPRFLAPVNIYAKTASGIDFARAKNRRRTRHRRQRRRSNRRNRV